MKFQINRRITTAILISVFAAFGLACQSQNASNSNASNAAVQKAPRGEGGTTPTDAYIKLYTAVKAKQIDAIKAVLSERTISFAEAVAQRQNQPVEKVFENGFTATTFAETLPEIREERIKGDMGAVEVYDAKDARWEDLPFIKEEGSWRLAIGDIFAGKHESPGKGRAQIEAEAATNNLVPVKPNLSDSDTGKTLKPVLPKGEPSVEKK